MKVIVIRIEGEYLPAVAKDYKTAIQYLVNERWIDERTVIWIKEEDKCTTIKGAGIKLEDIKNYDRDTFEKYFGYEYELLERDFIE